MNVGGHRRLRPSMLAAQLAHLDAVNIGAAGTLVVRARVPQARLRAELQRLLPFDATIVICDARAIRRLVAADPFALIRGGAGTTRFVSVLQRRPRLTPTLPLFLPSRRGWLVRVLGRDDRFVIGQYRRHLKVIGLLGEVDRLFGVRATTRGWGTIDAIVRRLD